MTYEIAGMTENTKTDTKKAVNISECTCKEGFYHPALSVGEKCIECPEGAVCKGGTALPEPQEGYWAEKNFR